jgi:hypothetical protein
VRRAARRAPLGLAALLTIAAPTAGASPFVEVHFSVKVIRNPAGGARPPVDDADPGLLLTDSHVQAMMLISNTLLNSPWWRGYRFVLDEIVDVGSPCASCPATNPSSWYAVPFADGATPTLEDFEDTAKANAAAFAWRSNAVNVYVNQGKGDGAVASFPPPDPRSNDVVMVGSRVFDPSYVIQFPAATFVHEIGHYFGLPHPNGSVNPCCDPATCILDGDGIGDTLPDGPCFTRDQLAVFNFGVPDASLTPYQRGLLDDIWTNNMGYLHPGQAYGQQIMDRRTEGQLDHWTDTANGVRAAVRSGRTWFVDPNGGVFVGGTSTDPFVSVPLGIAAANAAGGDIVLIRPGTYSVSGQITKRVTLRATRRGAAVLVVPGGLASR